MTLRPRSNSLGARQLSAIPLSRSLLKFVTEVWDKRATIKHSDDVYDLYNGIETIEHSVPARTHALTEFFRELSFLGMITKTGPYLQGFTSIPFNQLVFARKQYVNYNMSISNIFMRMEIVACAKFFGLNDVSPEEYLLYLMDEDGFLTFNRANSLLQKCKIKHRVYLNVKISCNEELLLASGIMSYVVRQILEKINGIASVKISVANRIDTIVIYTTNIAATNKVIATIQEYQNNYGVSGFSPEIPMMAQPQIYGVATASEPPQVTIIKGQLQPAQMKQSFGSLRTELIYDALKNSTGCSDFYELIVKYFREAGIDASQPAMQSRYYSCLWEAQRSFVDQAIMTATNL